MTLSPADVGLPKRKKSTKGSVSIYVLNDRLRLRWQARDAVGKSKRFSFAVGASNDLNRKAAERLALQIEMDITSGNFDHTLLKYLPKERNDEISLLGVNDLFSQFIKAQSGHLEAKSLEKYQILQKSIGKYFGNLPLCQFREPEASAFVTASTDRNLKGSTINAYLTLLRAVWTWGLKRKLTIENPWTELKVKKESPARPQPFSAEEVDQILKAFSGDFYYDFVLFVMSVGCRPSEAIALDWEAVTKDCSQIWIGTSYSQKEKRIKSTKNNKARDIPISPSVQAILQRRRAELVKPEGAVFLAPKGNRIDLHNFTKRNWQNALEKAGIPYRSFYNSRHSQWTKEVVAGMDIATAAYLAGNTPRTMVNTYLGVTKLPRLKDWVRTPDKEPCEKTDTGSQSS